MEVDLYAKNLYTTRICFYLDIDLYNAVELKSSIFSVARQKSTSVSSLARSSNL
jgi:hypothetical protein